MTEDQARTAIYTVVTTVAEMEPMASPQSHIMLGLQTQGVIGNGLDDWYTVLDIGTRLGWWKTTSETVKLTDQGREIAQQIEEVLAR
jgi:hypothetical protein